MRQPKVKDWKRSLRLPNGENYPASKLYEGELAETIAKAIPGIQAVDAAAKEIRGIIFYLEFDLLGRQRPTPKMKRDNLEKYRDLLVEADSLLSEMSDDSRTLLEDAAAIDDEHDADQPLRAVADRQWARHRGAYLSNEIDLTPAFGRERVRHDAEAVKRLARWAGQAASGIAEERGHRIKLDAERIAIAHLKEVWLAMSYRKTIKDAVLIDFAKLALRPALELYPPVPELDKVVRSVILDGVDWDSRPVREHLEIVRRIS